MRRRRRRMLGCRSRCVLSSLRTGGAAAGAPRSIRAAPPPPAAGLLLQPSAALLSSQFAALLYTPAPNLLWPYPSLLDLQPPAAVPRSIRASPPPPAGLLLRTSAALLPSPSPLIFFFFSGHPSPSSNPAEFAGGRTSAVRTCYTRAKHRKEDVSMQHNPKV